MIQTLLNPLQNSEEYLIIEDSEIDVIVVDRLIRSYYPSLKPIITSNGMQGIKLLKDRINRGINLPAFIILDLVMPLMNGFDFLEIYERDFFKNNFSNIIVLTSSIHELDKRKALNYKCVKTYMVKPFSIKDFLCIHI
ncbi:response regulator [Chondrinema litorale]|uniref:response regulator n=1 Tax=Chondrinema litorale TaxID=2994555 RepID=UPI003D6F6080